MLLTINQIITWHDDQLDKKWDERVLHIFPETRQVVVIDVNDKQALPFFRRIEDLEDEVERGNAVPIEGDPYAPRHYTEEELESKKFRKIKRRLDKALKIIEPLFNDENAVRMLFEQDRASLINTRLEEINTWPKNEKACRQMIYTYCRRWWQHGQVPNAVLSRYDNCGTRRDKPRKITKKLGRPCQIARPSPKPGEPTLVTGVNMRHEWVDKILLGCKLFLENRLKPSYEWAYEQTLARFFIKDKVIEKGEEKIITLDPFKGEIFTKGQFRYHYLLHRNPNRATLKREGPKKFNTRHRQLKGKSWARGPGFRYLVDATIADMYLVSRYGKNLIVGRPVIWVMIDLFSRMITGVCVRFEAEGWLGLKLVLENTVEDKVAFCARYGIKITKEQWPARHRPVEILGDRGSLIKKTIKRFIKATNIIISNAPPYRPDWKGVIERIFREMNIKVFNWLPGFVDPERDPGDPDYRLCAAFDIEEFTGIVIEAVLHHNNECLISDGVEICPEFLATDLEPYPTQLFMWGAKNKPGGLRETDFDAVRRSLLSEGQVSVNKGEIKFKHPKAPKPLIYKCDQLQDEGLLLRNTGSKGRKFPVLFDERWTDEIYLIRQAGGALLPSQLRDANSIHVNRDWAETVQYLDEVKAQRDRSASNVLQNGINYARRLQERAANAKRKLKEARDNGPTQSKSAALRGIPSNRKIETERMHEEEASQLRMGSGSGPAKSIPESLSQIPHDVNKRSRGPQIPNIAELRKKRMGR
jgi:putative transposase